MKKRVIVCLALSLAMLLTVLAGCSGGGGGRFSGNFKKATEEQKATAIKKIEKLVAAETAVKNNITLDGEAVNKKNMLFQATVKGSLTQDISSSASMTVRMDSKTVEKYDFTTAGAIKLYAKIDSNMEYSYKGLGKDEIKALKEAGIYGGGQKSSIEMFADTGNGEIYLSTKVPNSEGKDDVVKLCSEGFPKDQIEAYFQQDGDTTLSIEEILDVINDSVCLVSVDSKGNVKVSNIEDSDLEDLTYVVKFESDYDYSVQKKFKMKQGGMSLDCEITIIPTSDKVASPSDKGNYEKTSITELGTAMIQALTGLKR